MTLMILPVVGVAVMMVGPRARSFINRWNDFRWIAFFTVELMVPLIFQLVDLAGNKVKIVMEIGN